MPETRRVLLEVAVASAEDAQAAEAGGADRVELNSALLLGGLSPSLGTLIEARSRVTIPIVVMARPRAGGFHYSEAEFATMRRDVDLYLDHGADGVAFGLLQENGRIDARRTREIVAQVGAKSAVFHRAFDVTPDPIEALASLIDLGVTRVMTSGQEESAFNGAALIASLIERAAGKIEILPAGGINRFTIADVLARTGCGQVHASLKMTRLDLSTQSRPAISFGGALRPPESGFDSTNPQAVAEMRRRLDET